MCAGRREECEHGPGQPQSRWTQGQDGPEEGEAFTSNPRPRRSEQMGAEVWKRLSTEHITRGRTPSQREVTSWLAGYQAQFCSGPHSGAEADRCLS